MKIILLLFLISTLFFTGCSGMIQPASAESPGELGIKVLNLEKQVSYLESRLDKLEKATAEQEFQPSRMPPQPPTIDRLTQLEQRVKQLEQKLNISEFQNPWVK